MRITKLGPLKKAELELNNLTIFTGENNQGKTYVSYALYGLLQSFREIPYFFYNDDEVNIFRKTGAFTINYDDFVERIADAALYHLSYDWDEILSEVFQVDLDTFQTSQIVISKAEISKLLNLDTPPEDEILTRLRFKNTTNELRFNQDGVKIVQFIEESSLQNNDPQDMERSQTIMLFLTEILISNLISNFYIPAERVGLNVFRSQLNTNKIKLMDTLTSHFQNMNENSKHFSFNEMSEFKSYLAKPINDYLTYINSIEKYEINENENSFGRYIRNNLINGRFDLDKSQDKSYFRIKHGNKRYKKDAIPLHITSSSVKSFYGFDFYLERLNMNKLNYLIIDEPEMNLHPNAQIEFVNLLEILVTSGIKVIISTHSDFLIRKVQNIALKNRLDKNSAGINFENFTLYNFANQIIEPIDLLSTQDYENFNQSINSLEDEFIELLERQYDEEEENL